MGSLGMLICLGQLDQYLTDKSSMVFFHRPSKADAKDEPQQRVADNFLGHIVLSPTSAYVRCTL